MVVDNKKADSIDMRNSQSAKIVLLGFTLFFATVLTIGWYRFFEAQFPVPVPFILALVCAVSAIYLAKFIAEERAEQQGKRDHENSTNSNTWVIALLILFTISAFGTVNTVFYYSEGGVLIIEAIDNANKNLDMMQASAADILRNSDVEKKRATINGYLTVLEGEITNANGGKSCGVGKSAREIIGKIREQLPGFQELSGGGSYACAGSEDRFQQVANNYRKQAERLLANHPVYVAGNMAEKEALLREVQRQVQAQKEELNKAKAALAGEGGNVSSAGEKYAVARAALANTTEIYRTLYTELLKKGNPSQAMHLPSSMDIVAVQQLGSFSHIIPELMARMDRLSTWIYLVVALFFDVGLISLFQRVIGHNTLPESGKTPSVADKLATEEIRFLWVNKE